MSANLKQTVLELLSILPAYDRDIKSIVVCVNPNYCLGSDKELKPVVQSIIDELLTEGKVKAGKHTILNDMNHGSRSLRIYSIKNNSNLTLN